MLDIRIPMGLMFAIFGIILALFGFFSKPNIYDMHSLGHNINLSWGGFMLVFGGAMLFFARWKNQN
ncbi:MAG: LPXTG cell wall anchor domain-containing protein [Pirellulales bacterium]|nr:LPXTG cell wall anchor domain-containing protein [Pirellulales bacterium]